MQSFRSPRFKRAEVPPIQLTERDGEIIRLVHKYRFLYSSQVIRVLGNASSQPILRRLQLLYHHGYLERPRAQLEYYHEAGSRPIVYSLGEKGAALLNDNLAITFKRLHRRQKKESIGKMFLEHELFVSEIMVGLELACRASGRVRLLTGQDLLLNGSKRSAPFKWYVNVRPGLRLSVVPDQVFALEVSDQEGKPDRAYFFLEADRGTMPVKRKNLIQTSFFRKLLAYETTWVQSIHQKRFGFHRFRALTITTSPDRVRSLIKACGELQRGHGLFLFADRTVLERPSDILSRMWQTGKLGEATSLLN
jgi:hypothetical protein